MLSVLKNLLFKWRISEEDTSDNDEYLSDSSLEETSALQTVLDDESLTKKIANLLEKIEDIRNENHEVEVKNPFDSLEEMYEFCIYANGKITHMNDNCILIDGRYECEWEHVELQHLKIGDRVHYMGYKSCRNNNFKVRKIINKITTGWEEEENEDKNNYLQDIKVVYGWSLNDCDLPDKEIPATTAYPKPELIRPLQRRKHVGKVDSRSGRFIYLEDKTVINLNKVESNFIPCIGDHVELECLYEVDDEVANFKGELLEVMIIRPQKYWNLVGKVTEYNEDKEFGKIDKMIIFNKLSCLEGYVPCVGDEVAVQCIMSDQNLMTHWRAINIVPMSDLPKNCEMENLKFESQSLTGDIEELLRDKNDIEISKDTCITLNINERKTIGIKVKNKSNIPQVVRECMFIKGKQKSQLTLIQPKLRDLKVLRPGSVEVYTFECRPRLLGSFKEGVIFKFDKFKIGRIFEITVNSIIQSNEPPTENTIGKHITQSVIPQPYQDGMYIKGIKPFKPAKFIRVRPVTWKIPNLLWSTIDMIIQEKKTRAESVFALQEKIPYLNGPLNFNIYRKRFDYLLYLEEIALILNMKRFNMDQAIMHRCGEYLKLNVPGLAEKRPSLIVGDKVNVSFQWAKEDKRYEGYIHKIRSTDIYLKFHESFHQLYHSEECKVEFLCSTTVLQRCHTAISAVINTLGETFLFPKKVEEKEPQYNFIDEDEDEEAEKLPKITDVMEITKNEDRLRLAKLIILKKKLIWFNKKLNKYQKEAVKNILKGIARPLPYVIFGPPGTGKTVTVVETILQIHTVLTESTILIATPSNSSANLITQRLLETRILQPGDLIRLVAHHYLEEGLIPEQLLPYCVTVDIAAEGTRSNCNQVDSRGFRTQVTLSEICQHRIIIGTCTALGALYNMGCKFGHFTHILIDEAGQASEPEIMIPLSLAHKSSTQVVLAGDPKQLGPINQCRFAGYFGLNESFLARLLNQFPYQKDPEGFETGYDPRLITKLKINYRSLPELLALPNKLFYDNELIPEIHPEDSDEARLLELLADELPTRVGRPPAIVFYSVNGTNRQDVDSPSWYNLEETARISIYLSILYNNGLKPDDIGIITPYSRQVHQIKSQLEQLELNIPKVGSVEEFQGQERKIILLSTVRTSEGKVEEDLKHSLGFVSARERLNVAITRARALLIIFGHPKLLMMDTYWRNVLKYCLELGSIVSDDTELQTTMLKF